MGRAARCVANGRSIREMKWKKVDFLATPMGGDDLHADSINETDLQGL